MKPAWMCKTYGPLLLGYLVICFFLYQRFGVKLVLDSLRYLDYAKGLKSGWYVDGHNVWYLGYVIFVLLIQQITTRSVVVVIFQYLLGGLAVYTLTDTAYRLTQSRRAVWMVGILMIGFVDLGQWHSYLLAESLLTSFTCFTFWALVRYEQRPTPRRLMILFGLVLFTASIKPVGIALLGAILVWAWCRWSGKWIWLVVSVLLILIAANYVLQDFDLIMRYAKGEIVYGQSTVSPDKQYSSLLMVPAR